MFHVFWFSKNWAEKIETSTFLSAIFIFWRSDFAAGCEDAVEDSQPNCKSVCYHSNRLTVLTSISGIAVKSEPKKWKWRSEKCSYLEKYCTDMAEIRCGLRPHVYQGLEFFRSLCVMSSWSKTTSKSFVTKGDLMQQPLWTDSVVDNLKFEMIPTLLTAYT